ncbi:hypothetical protein ACFQUU_01630 [Herbaspirillum sp. GCM10030257]|uniref:hypothetical protein n=1 Tax=Herbaspirillum sp. GCM10030257 TaxID=3273393 RepID=UPI003612D187
MSNDYTIHLSGPFDLTDSAGRVHRITSVYIYDEGYGLIDVHAALASSDEEHSLHEDAAVIRQIISRLRSVGYVGPDFGLAGDDLQDAGLIVLEAPEAFGMFAAAKGWKNLAEDYNEGQAHDAIVPEVITTTEAIYFELMTRMRRP